MQETNILLDESEKRKMAGEHTEAIKICEKILHNDLNCSEAYEEIGDNYLSLREHQRAEKALKKALQINPLSANAHYLLGFLYSTIGNYTKSVDLLERADEIQSNHPEILRCLGWSIFHLGQKKKGLIILERALTMAPRDCLILCDLGVCYLNDRNFDRSIRLFQKAIDLEPSNQKAKECLNTAKFFEKEYKKIKSHLHTK